MSREYANHSNSAALMTLMVKSSSFPIFWLLYAKTFRFVYFRIVKSTTYNVLLKLPYVFFFFFFGGGGGFHLKELIPSV